MAKGQTVGMLPTSALVQVLGENLEIRKSGRDGAKFPLYLSCKIGPIPINTRDGQDILLELGSFKGAPGSDPEPAPEKTPEPSEPVPEQKPEPAKQPRWFQHDPELEI